ncbi:hypothetical protein BDV28DRAFT_105799 [Aspergillus coremiiformis]|uniref:Uncharacterized protein n=1 Tax=Aspergillus coremiiformis TaxID=138285 RepID=A0A5N6Z790_9EURO|nr:hypothetical protein BDV28DRAFT_105799 [Aspergillus coremiiformis]
MRTMPLLFGLCVFSGGLFSSVIYSFFSLSFFSLYIYIYTVLKSFHISSWVMHRCGLVWISSRIQGGAAKG